MGDKPASRPQDNKDIFPDAQLRGTIGPEKEYELASAQTLDALMILMLHPKKVHQKQLQAFGDALYNNYFAIAPMKRVEFLLEIESVFVGMLGYSGLRIAQQLREYINLGKNEVVLQMIGQHISSSVQISNILDKKTQKNLLPKLQSGWYRSRQQTNAFIMSVTRGQEIPYSWMELVDMDFLKRNFESYLYRQTAHQEYWKELKKFLNGQGKIFLGTYNSQVVEWGVADIEPETRDTLLREMGVYEIPI